MGRDLAPGASKVLRIESRATHGRGRPKRGIRVSGTWSVYCGAVMATLFNICLPPTECPYSLLSKARFASPAFDRKQVLLKSAETREEDDIEAATAQMERALRVEGWL
jgi:hypothetical protein